MDSLDLVELAQIVEDDYGVQLKGEDMEGVKTVRQAVDLVVSKLCHDPHRRHHRRGRGDAAGRRRPHPARALERRASPASRTATAAADEFEPKEHLSIKEVRRSDRFTQFALAAAEEALDEAGWEDGPPGDPDAHRLRDRHGHRRHRHARGPARRRLRDDGPGGAYRRWPIPLLMANAASRRGGHEARPARPVVRHRVRLRGRRARDRAGLRLIAYGDADASSPAAASRRSRRSPRRPSRAWARRSPTAACRVPSTRAATDS